MKTLLVAGAGQGLGKSVAKRFAREGYAVALAARNKERLSSLAQEIGASPFPTDLTNEGDVASLFRNVEVKLGAIEAVAFVAATRVQGPFAELSAADFENVWRQSCLSGFLVGREAARAMLPRARGSVIFTGASGSTRGRADFAAFAAAKGGLRFMAQSMARELGPEGIHVAHVVIDGPIDMPWIRENFPDLVAQRPADGLLKPDDIAETYFALHQQPRSAWTFEIDLRPWVEPW